MFKSIVPEKPLYRDLAISITMFVIFCIATGGAYLLSRVDARYAEEQLESNTHARAATVEITPTNGAPLFLPLTDAWGINDELTNFWRTNLQIKNTWVFIDTKRPTLELLVLNVRTEQDEQSKNLLKLLSEKIFAITMPVKIEDYRSQNLAQTRFGFKGHVLVTQGTTLVEKQPITQLQWMAILTQDDKSFWLLYLKDQIPEQYAKAAALTDYAFLTNVIQNIQINASK